MIKILIIEDEPDQALNLRYILEFNGFEVFSAENGKIGVDIAIKELPDLILTDINMPVMNGHEVIRKLRTMPETYSIPVLFLTANKLKEDQRLGMELGADDYITKPYTSTEILNAINARLSRDGDMKRYFETKLNELRKNITVALPHELNTPISSILGFSQMIKSRRSVLSDSDIDSMCDSIYESGQRLAELVKKFNTYISLVSKSADDLSLKGKKTRDTSYIIYEISTYLASKYQRENDLILDNNDLSAAISENHFMTLLEEIIDNAFKFSISGTKVTITSKAVGSFICISISNTGRGIDKIDIKKVGAYMQFERKSYEQQGLGLGLAIAKRITDVYDGSLDIKSKKGQNTTVEIQIPMGK